MSLTLCALVQKYGQVNMFNVENFGLCYREVPNWTIRVDPLKRKKKNKERLVNGTERLPTLVFGHSSG